MLETTDILDDGQASARSGFDPVSISRFVKASGWITFLSVLFYVLGGIFSLICLVSLVFAGFAGGIGVVGVLVGFGIIIGFLFVLGRQFQNLGSATAAFKKGGATRQKTNELCRSLKGVYSTIGIFSAIFIFLTILQLLLQF
ncbi:MAG: hypothetical protein AAF741_03610 [Bacteroidota bacterium]